MEAKNQRDEKGANEARTLKGGEVVGLVQEPGAKWRIRYYEFAQRVRYDLQAGGLVLAWMQGIPNDWRELEFESADEAEAFVQDQIGEGKVPGDIRAGSKQRLGSQ